MGRFLIYNSDTIRQHRRKSYKNEYAKNVQKILLTVEIVPENTFVNKK